MSDMQEDKSTTESPATKNVAIAGHTAPGTTTSKTLSCHRCGMPGHKTDGHSRVWCRGCLGLLTRPAPRHVEKLPGRNDKCSCGSGMKYKLCCINKTK